MNGCAARSKRGSTCSVVEELLDGALRAEEAARDDPAERASARRGSCAAGRQVDVRDLEQRDVLVAGVDVVARRADEAVEERRAQHALLGRERLGQLERVRIGIVGLRASTCTPRRSPAPTSTSSTARRSRWACVSRPNIAVPLGQRRRHLLELGSARPPRRGRSRGGRRARATVGTRHGPVVRRRRSRAASSRSPLLVGRDRRARRRARARSGRSAIAGRSGSSAVHVRVARSSARRRARRAARSRSVAACSASSGSTPFSQRSEPSVRRRSRSPLRRTPSGSKFAASSRTTVVVVGDLGLLAAHDPGERDGALGVGDHEVVARRARARVPSSVRELLARRRRGGRRSARPASVVVVEGVERAAEREHHVVRHVDDVRDRPHAGGEQARLQPRRATRRPPRRGRARPM